jgi:hypothetical protein
MDTDALRNALSAIAGAANDALAAMSEPGPVEVVEVEPAHDYHAEELERIEAQADATVKVIEAEAAAAVAVIEAQTDDDDDDQGAAVDALDDALDDAVDDNPIMAAEAVEEAGDIASTAEAVEEAGDVLDALPVIDPVAIVEDVAPAPAHWYRRRISLFG